MTVPSSVWDLSRKTGEGLKTAPRRVRLTQPPSYGRITIQNRSRAERTAQEVAAHKATGILKLNQLDALTRGRRAVE